MAQFSPKNEAFCFKINPLQFKCFVQKLIEIILQSEKDISPAYLKTDILTSIHFIVEEYLIFPPQWLAQVFCDLIPY